MGKKLSQTRNAIDVRDVSESWMQCDGCGQHGSGVGIGRYAVAMEMQHLHAWAVGQDEADERQ
jgi:hypothetical protein